MKNDPAPIDAARVNALHAFTEGATRMDHHRSLPAPRQGETGIEGLTLQPEQPLGRRWVVLGQVKTVQPHLTDRHRAQTSRLREERIHLRKLLGPVVSDRAGMQTHGELDIAAGGSARSRYSDQSSVAVPIVITASTPAARARSSTAGNSPRRW